LIEKELKLKPNRESTEETTAETYVLEIDIGIIYNEKSRKGKNEACFGIITVS